MQERKSDRVPPDVSQAAPEFKALISGIGDLCRTQVSPKASLHDALVALRSS